MPFLKRLSAWHSRVSAVPSRMPAFEFIGGAYDRQLTANPGAQTIIAEALQNLGLPGMR
jgi:hypothetical protein